MTEKTVEALVEELQVLTGSRCRIETCQLNGDPQKVGFVVLWRLALGPLGCSEWQSGMVGWSEDASCNTLAAALGLALQEATRLKTELLQRLQTEAKGETS
jgi:hypothetical protein